MVTSAFAPAVKLQTPLSLQASVQKSPHATVHPEEPLHPQRVGVEQTQSAVQIDWAQAPAVSSSPTTHAALVDRTGVRLRCEAPNSVLWRLTYSSPNGRQLKAYQNQPSAVAARPRAACLVDVCRLKALTEAAARQSGLGEKQ